MPEKNACNATIEIIVLQVAAAAAAMCVANGRLDGVRDGMAPRDGNPAGIVIVVATRRIAKAQAHAHQSRHLVETPKLDRYKPMRDKR